METPRPSFYCQSHLAPRHFLGRYYRDAGRERLLTAQEEQDLARRVRAGDRAARDQLVSCNLRLVIAIAKFYQGRGLDLEDLIGEGNLGLFAAVEHYDPDRQTRTGQPPRFSTCATLWIRQAVVNAIRWQTKTVRQPHYVWDLMARWRQARAELLSELGYVPTSAEISARLRLGKFQSAVAVDAERETQALGGLDVEARAPAPDAAAERRELPLDLEQLVCRLDPRSAEVIRSRFGLDGHAPETLKEVGERIGLTRERVRQLEVKALARLRELWFEGE